ncbi:MAG: hypothetical protein QOD00_1886, partial [Blastocatellia bacterium]|nr:hypothetical protein [Blastocatellia bacterium]
VYVYVYETRIERQVIQVQNLLCGRRGGFGWSKNARYQTIFDDETGGLFNPGRQDDARPTQQEGFSCDA